MNCNDCVKRDVCAQKEIMMSFQATLATTGPIEIRQDFSTTPLYLSQRELLQRYGIKFEAKCSKFMGARGREGVRVE